MNGTASAEGNGPMAGRRLVVVSNRLPCKVRPAEDADEWRVEPSSGGLVTAMSPVLRRHGGVWIGWPGVTREAEAPLDRLLPPVGRELGFELRPVPLTGAERDNFYLGFSNEVVWPLFHDLQTLYNFDPAYWRTYRDVNRKYAEAIARHVEPDDYVWVHDYHLMMVAQELRDLGFEGRVGFFLHTPFPSPDIYMKLPWRFEILRGLLEYDLVGFQTLRDRRNFLHCVRRLLADVPVAGAGAVVSCCVGGRDVRVGSFPISIDYDAFAEAGADPEVIGRCVELRKNLPDRQLILGVDRLDYTKGIPYRLEGFDKALERHPELHGRVTLIQLVVPSREVISEYGELKEDIERLVGRINGQYTRQGWVPIYYMYRSLERSELIALYRSADIALITPLKDGMNLVAKEFCAADVDEESVLVLSEFAGAADQLQDGALLVNPYDIEGLAEAIHRAFHMPQEERRGRMAALREKVREEDIFWWVELFLRAAVEEEIGNFPVLSDYTPRGRLMPAGT